MREATRRLTDHLSALTDGYLVVVTGAGVSVASGIATFRGSDPDAVWKRDITELGTVRFFRQHPVASWRWYLDRFAQVTHARPNPAHQALAALERWHGARGGRFLLVTQNIDTLHRQAGSERLIEVHGRADRVRCAREGCRNGAPRGSLPRDAVAIEPFLDQPSGKTLPTCPACGELLRQHVLWFDEYYTSHQDYGWSSVEEAARDADLVLFVGTSFAVGVTAMFLQQGARRQIPMLSIDPTSTPPPHAAVEALRAGAEHLLPDAVAVLTQATGSRRDA